MCFRLDLSFFSKTSLFVTDPVKIALRKALERFVGYFIQAFLNVWRLFGVTVRPRVLSYSASRWRLPVTQPLIPAEDSWVTSPHALIQDTSEAVFRGVSRFNTMLTITLKTLQQQTFKVQIDEELTVSVRVCARVNMPVRGHDALGNAAASGGWYMWNARADSRCHCRIIHYNMWRHGAAQSNGY